MTRRVMCSPLPGQCRDRHVVKPHTGLSVQPTREGRYVSGVLWFMLSQIKNLSVSWHVALTLNISVIGEPGACVQTDPTPSEPGPPLCTLNPAPPAAPWARRAGAPPHRPLLPGDGHATCQGRRLPASMQTSRAAGLRGSRCLEPVLLLWAAAWYSEVWRTAFTKGPKLVFATYLVHRIWASFSLFCIHYN